MKDVFPGTEPVTRIQTPMPDETHLAALPARVRRDGQICEITTLPGEEFVFRQASISPAAVGQVVVPNDIAALAAYAIDPTTAPGRWENKGFGSASTLPRLSARLAQDSNVAATRVGNVLTANANGAIANIDGKAPALNDRILYWAQTAGADDGIYALTSLGSGGTPWKAIRVVDMNNSGEVVNGMSVYISDGNNYGGQTFGLTTPNPIVLNTTALTFVEKSNLITLTLAISLAQLQAAGATHNYNFTMGAAAVPPGARFRGAEVILTPLDDATHSTYVLNLGWSGTTTALAAAQDIAAATATGYPKGLNGAAAFAGASAIGGKSITGSIVGGVNLSTLTAGAVSIALQFSVGA